MDFGKALIDIRNRKGYNQRELAEECGISPATLCNIETGKSQPHAATIQAISKAMKIKASALVIASLTEEDVEPGKWEMVKLMKEYILSPIHGEESPKSEKEEAVEAAPSLA
jgi:transcriptional regulator with XRE-family HTH domain